MNEININFPLISIVTVTYNNATELEETIKSVCMQTYKNIEYIIIDGGSTDHTLSVLNSYNENISYWISEKDDGIYDAMNKGHSIASGNYIFFLNSGDILSEPDVLARIFTNKQILQKIPFLIMGKIECQFDKQFCWISNICSEINIQYSPPHQAIFIKKDIYKKYNYNKYFKILGDRDYWLRLFYDGLYKIYTVDTIISRYSLGGISSNPKNICIYLREVMILSCLYQKNINYILLAKELFKNIAKINIYYLIGSKNYYKFIGKYIHKLKMQNKS